MIRAMTASVAPRDSEPGVAHDDLGRVDVEPQEAQQRADDQRAQERDLRLGRDVEQRDDQERDERERERAAGRGRRGRR